jgi:DNA-binding winged helix-turn-helix (wHTH) protein
MRTPSEALYVGPLLIDSTRNLLLTADGKQVALRARSFALLRLLVENAGAVLTRETILATLWPNTHVVDDSITQCIHEIRHILGSERRHLLRTVPRRGYLIEADNIIRATSARSVDTPASQSVALSVLVQPFTSRDGSRANERLAAHITADMVTDLLTCLNGWASVPATILLGRRSDTGGEQPGGCATDYHLQGTLHRAQGVFLNLQLIHCQTRRCVWASRLGPCGAYDHAASFAGLVATALLRDAGQHIDAMPAASFGVRKRAPHALPPGFQGGAAGRAPPVNSPDTSCTSTFLAIKEYGTGPPVRRRQNGSE